MVAEKAIAPFTGFPDTKLSFFRELDAHQDREWFQSNRARFEAEWQGPMVSLLHAAQAKLAPKYKGFTMRTPKLFRLHRDIRFSTDKKLYKTQSSGLLGFPNPREYAEAPAVLYLQIGLEASFGAAGLWMMDAVSLAQYREAVLDKKRGAALQRLMDALAEKGFSFEGAAAPLKTAPRGIAKDHPRIELLRRRGLAASYPKLPLKEIGKPGFVDWVVEHSITVSPLVKWLLEM